MRIGRPSLFAFLAHAKGARRELDQHLDQGGRTGRGTPSFAMPSGRYRRFEDDAGQAFGERP